MENRKAIKSFKDLIVYQNLYRLMVIILTKVTQSIPKEEKYDLKDQLSRSCKAGPALIAEGFAKRYQKKNWEKYINDCLGECNETIHHLSICIDVYPNYVDKNLCEQLVNDYDITCKQLTNLKKAWKNFHEKD